MRVIVSDTSCLIDLRKGDLLEAAFQLPYEFVMPDTLYEDEILNLTPDEKGSLLRLGLVICELGSVAVQRAGRYRNEHRRLSLNDCFALSLAETIDNSILLTGDRNLRAVAENTVEVHGVLWATDKIEEHELATKNQLYGALLLFQQDPLVFLPPVELAARLRHLEQR